MAPLPLLTLSNVTRRFGRHIAVADVSLAVAPGEIHALVGPNGSGKSTLARLAAGLLRPHAGSVSVAGEDPRSAPASRRVVGYLGHQSLLYRDLTAVENLRFVAQLHGLEPPGAAVHSALDRCGVGEERHLQVGRLSRGMTQRVALARSLVQQPQIVVWDEPLTGLDQASVRRTVALADSERERGAGVVLVTHDLGELWQLPATVHVLHRGAVRRVCSTSIPLAEFEAQYREAVGA